jgi:hypothetical protein
MRGDERREVGAHALRQLDIRIINQQFRQRNCIIFMFPDMPAVNLIATRFSFGQVKPRLRLKRYDMRRGENRQSIYNSNARLQEIIVAIIKEDCRQA